MEIPEVNDNVLKPKPYVPAKPLDLFLEEKGLSSCIKLDANENPLGCSTKIIPELGKLQFNRYPDGGATKLRAYLAKGLKLKPENLFISPGSNQIIDFALRAFLKPGNKTIMANKTFSLYKSATLKNSGEPVEKPLKAGNFNLKNMAKAIDDKTDVVFICNPNNPTGTLLTRDEITEFIEEIPSRILVVVDEAYIEFSEEYATVIDLISKYPNLLVMRTFSKIYGLAGFRIGYAAANEKIIEVVNKVITPFSLSTPALEAAYIALQDLPHIEQTYRNNFIERKRMSAFYASKEWFIYPSQTNFFYVEIPIENIREKLEERGILIRPLTSFGFGKQSYRITIGTPDENSALIKAIETIMM